MELKINAAKTRAVSARELCRRMAGLLDEIESNGSGLGVLRYGRPTALLVPLEPKARRAPRKVSIEECEEEFETPELEERHQRLLLEMSRCAPKPYEANDWAGEPLEFARTFVRLEMAGLAETSVGGRRWLTERGQVVVAKLQT